MTMSHGEDTVGLPAALAATLESSGLDIAHPLALSWYNDSLPVGLGARIPPQGKAGQAALVILIANTKHIWEPFLETLAAQPELLAADDPVDEYVQSRVEAALDRCAPRLRRRVFFSHQRTAELEGSSEYVAFQRMAHAAALAFLDQSCHLCMHPKFGTWLSLRACVVFDDVPFTEPLPAPLANPLELDRATQRYVELAMQSALHNTSTRWHLEEVDVEAAVATMLDAANEEAHPADEEPPTNAPSPLAAAAGVLGTLRRTSMDVPPPCMHAVRASWKKWVAVRDAPCSGHFWRYPNEMIEYHYTGDRATLALALKRRGLLPAPPSPERHDLPKAMGRLGVTECM